MRVPRAVWWFLGLAALGLAVASSGVARATHAVDFPVYYEAARDVLRGDARLYPPEIYDGRPLPTSHTFGYAPVVAVLLAPLGLLPVGAATLVFLALNLAALVHTVLMVSRLLGIEGRRAAQAGAVAVIASGSYLVEDFRNGNAHFLTCWMVVLAVYLIERGRAVVPSAALALSIAVKLAPMLVVAYLALQRRWQVVWRTAGALAGLAVAPSFVFGVTANAKLLRGFALFAQYKSEEPGNRSLRGLVIRVFTGTPVVGAGSARPALEGGLAVAVNVIWIAMVIAILAALYVMARRQARSPESMLLQVSAVTAAMLLIGPHAQRLYFSTLFFPCCVFAALVARRPPDPDRRLLQVTLVVSCLVSTLVPLLVPGRGAFFAYENLLPHTFLALAIFAVAAKVGAR